MDLMLVLIAVTAFPVACLAFVLWMGLIEDSIPSGVRRAVHRPDPPPILAVPVRRTAQPETASWWESVAVEEGPALDGAEAHTRRGGTPRSAPPKPAPDGIPEQRTSAAPALPTPALPTPLPALPATEPLAGT